MPSTGSKPDSVEPRHRLLFELGRGGMGTVYLALARGPAGFHKLKVVKQLRYELAEDIQFLNMFMDEARLSARLNHPNIVQTNEVGFDGTSYFIEMEYLEGQSLDAIQRRSSRRDNLPLPVSLWILAQACAALHYAHELRDHDGTPLEIVHRDVSPHNIFVTYEGAVKVLDFGIAKAIDSSSETRTGVVKGKATYMAPEQAARGRVDRRADVFALGVMLWQTVTGKRLYEGLSDGEIFLKLERGDVPPVRAEAPDVSPSLEAIVMRAIAPDASDRYPTAADLQIALEDYLESETKHVGARQVATLVSELFKDRREAVRVEIEHKMRAATSSTAVDASIPRLEQAPGVRATTTGPTHPDAISSSATPEMTRRATPKSARTNAARADETRSGRGTVPAVEKTPTHETNLNHASTHPAPRDATLRRTGWRSPNAALAASALVLLGAGLTLWRASTRTTGPNPAPSLSAVGSASVIAPAGACVSNAQCVQANGGRPFICRRGDHQCTSLATEDCDVLARTEDLSNEDTLWLGAMFARRGPRAEEFGNACVNSLDLARRDFLQASGGIPIKGTVHPLALVACDDTVDARRAANHLIDDVGVPAIAGFSSSQEVLDLAPSLLLPRGILSIATINQSPLISQIASGPGQPRLVWQTVTSAPQVARPIARLVSDVLEAKVRKAAPSLRAKDAIRVALVSVSTTVGLSFRTALFDRMTFNGKTALENGSSFRDFSVGDPTDAKTRPEYQAAVEDILHFHPNVVIYLEGDYFLPHILEPLESAWPADAPRPYYAASLGEFGDADLVSYVEKHKELRRRLFGIQLPMAVSVNAKFAMHYNDSYTPKVTPANAPGVVYDGLYLLAYAAHVAGEARPSGIDMARAIARLVPPGRAVEIGPTTIVETLRTLDTDGRADLVGAGTTLDFNLATGEPLSDFAVICMSGRGGRLEGIDSGAVYKAATDAITGTLDCE